MLSIDFYSTAPENIADTLATLARDHGLPLHNLIAVQHDTRADAESILHQLYLGYYHDNASRMPYYPGYRAAIYLFLHDADLVSASFTDKHIAEHINFANADNEIDMLIYLQHIGTDTIAVTKLLR